MTNKIQKTISPKTQDQLKLSANQLPLPDTESIKKICDLYLKTHNQKHQDDKYAPVKNVLMLLGRGAIITAAILAPKTARRLSTLVRQTSDWDDWKHFNTSYLQRTLKRLESQKLVEVEYKESESQVKLTQNGHRKILKYSLDNLEINPPKHWDGKWRIIFYDIPKDHHHTRDVIRNTLNQLGFYKLQESVYIYPYSCFDQIEFLRQYYFLGSKIQYMLVEYIENHEAYKTYFNLS